MPTGYLGITEKRGVGGLSPDPRGRVKMILSKPLVPHTVRNKHKVTPLGVNGWMLWGDFFVCFWVLLHLGERNKNK